MPAPGLDDFLWLSIEDFTPGIITNSQLAYAPNGSNGNTGPVPGNKTGQAQSAVGCIALPSGGLGPLPGLSASPIPPNNTPGGVTIINGLFVMGPYYDSSGSSAFGDYVVYGEMRWDLASTWDFWLVGAPRVPGSAPTQLNLVILSNNANAPLSFTMCTGDTTSANNTPSDTGVVTLAVALWWIYYPGASPGSYLWLFPDPTNPDATAPYVMISDTAPSADVICHQNRIIALSNLVVNAGIAGGDTVATNAAELFNYTDPPNGLALGSQSETFVQEQPFGAGTWGSINASELFVVKHRGGGYFIEGDLNNPTVIRLPGVLPTYGLQCRGDGTVLGFAYASNNRGVWVWNGGQNSTKISEQLDDNFFVNPYLPTAAQRGVAHGPTVDVRAWGDWIIVTNDWLFDTNTGGWWQLTQSTRGQPHLYYGVSSDGNTLYASVPQPSNAVGIDIYSRLTPTHSFSWTSYPMRPQGSPDRNYSPQQVVVRAQGNGTVTIQITGYEGSSSSTTTSPSDVLTFEATSDTSQPRMQEIRTGLVSQDITVEITSTGASGYPAPVVYSVAIGYKEQNLVSAT